MPATEGEREGGDHIKFSPREFLKGRRPERFSDSVIVQQPVLDRTILEYHLDSLTSRSQENDFERFARRIAEKEICPNLLPHTGPTGGGDSKVDTETYPVSDSLSLTWYVGIGREAAAERWAFAFSAQKKWRDKINADIAKIATTRREYRKAFFVSNQFIPDRVRAKVEDELRNKYGLDVRIIDRSWILDKVLGNGHQDVAIEELKLSDALRPQRKQGPMDFQKESELKDLENRIKVNAAELNSGFQFVQDCIHSAELARDLELPRTEVEGKFLRAKRAADDRGTEYQKLACAYQLAWTSYWWFEDFKLFLEQYEAVQKLVEGSNNAHDLELLSNLWFNLCGALRAGYIKPEDANLGGKTRFLKSQLVRLKSAQDRPSASLQAEATELLVDLTVQLPDNPGPLLKKTQKVIKKCAGMIGFPLEPFVEILSELGEILGEQPDYENLYETMVDTVSRRKGEIAAANVLVKRGAQKLDAQKPYDAIRFLGRPLLQLYKHESRDEVVRALYLCGSAYDQVGLLWAARGSILVAASIAAGEFWSYGDITPSQELCYNRLRWLEIRLGRLPHALAWNELNVIVGRILRDQGFDAKKFAYNDVHFDMVLAMPLLRSDIWQLKQLSRLPDTLDRFELPLSAGALRFALGHDAQLPEKFMPKATAPQDIERFMFKWIEQPATKELPRELQLYEGRRATLTSVILGCKITVGSDNSTPCVELSESILAALESFLATGMVNRLAAKEPALTITVRKSDFAAAPFTFDMKEHESRPHIEVICAAFNAHAVSSAIQGKIKEKLIHLLAALLERVFVMEDFKKELPKLLDEELALDRAVHFTSSFVTLGNVLGHDPKSNIDLWISSESKDFKLKRSEEWNAAARRIKVDGRESAVESKQEATKPRKERSDLHQIKHSELEILSLIRLPLWDRAEWSGTAFFLTGDGSQPPVLAPLFKNADAAAEIFLDWRKNLGFKDENDRLRLTLIRGIERANPHAYRVVIGANPPPTSSGTHFTMIVRSNTMEPNTDINLRNFLEHHRKKGCYFLAYSILKEGEEIPELVIKNSILKRELHVREAWEIGPHDLDMLGIKADDNPIIPAGNKSAPIAEVLELLKRRQRRT